MAEILFEFVKQGIYVKVSVIDVERNIEASVVVPATLSEEQMKQHALRRLQYISNKNK